MEAMNLAPERAGPAILSLSSFTFLGVMVILFTPFLSCRASRFSSQLSTQTNWRLLAMVLVRTVAWLAVPCTASPWRTACRVDKLDFVFKVLKAREPKEIILVFILVFIFTFS